MPFISRYNEKFGNSSAIIGPCRSLVLDLFQHALRGSNRASSLDAFQDALKRAHEDVPDMLAAIIFAKRQELSSYLTHRVLQQTTDAVLLDYNYNIETVIASDSLMKVNEQMLVLELIL